MWDSAHLPIYHICLCVCVCVDVCECESVLAARYARCKTAARWHNLTSLSISVNGTNRQRCSRRPQSPWLIHDVGGSKQEQTEAFCCLFSLSPVEFFFHVVPVFLISPQEGENYTFNYMVGVEGGSRRGSGGGRGYQGLFHIQSYTLIRKLRLELGSSNQQPAPSLQVQHLIWLFIWLVLS